MISLDEREREGIVLDLQSGDEDVRRLAVERLSALDPEEAAPRLVEILGDESWRVRKAAVERLCAVPEVDTIAELLIAALADGENPGRRNAAVDALIRLGRSALPHLIAALVLDDVDVRKFAVDALAGIGDEASVPALVARLEDPDPNVRAAAADALGAIGGEAASRALLGATLDAGQDALVRFSALHAVAGLELPLRAGELASALEDPVLRPAALDVLGRVDDDAEADDVLLKALEASGRASREAAMRATLRRLARVDGATADHLAARARDVTARAPDVLVSAIERLAEADLPTRLVIAQFLGVAGDGSAAVPLLLAASDEAIEDVAIASLVALGAPAEGGIDEVWGQLDVAARRAGCRFFARASGGRSHDRLRAALEDADPAVRCEAAAALAERGAVTSVVALVARLGRASLEPELEAEEECQALTSALVRLAEGAVAAGDEATPGRLVEMLAGALDGAGEPVRVAIARVVGRIGRTEDGEVLALLLKDPAVAVRQAAIEALASFQFEVPEPLRLAMADEASEVRIAVARALGTSGDPDAFESLCALVEDEDGRVRAAAVRAIGMGYAGVADSEVSARALELLEAAFRDEAPVALAGLEASLQRQLCPRDPASLLRRGEPEVVRETIRCVGANGDPESLAAVVPLCGHDDWAVRSEAIQVLADRRVSRALPEILRRLDVERDDFVRRVILEALARLEG